MSAAEVTILLIVGIVVVGPQKLPAMMRGAGKWIAKLRRMSTDLRAQSGIDKILREEGLEKEIRDLRALHQSLSKQAVFDTLVNAVNRPDSPARPLPPKIAKEPEALGAKPADPVTAELEAGPPKIEAEPPAPLLRPAEGTIARGDDLAEPAAAEVKNPYDSFRELEYPYLGPDHYDAMPDDFEEDEEAAPPPDVITPAKSDDEAEPRGGMAE